MRGHLTSINLEDSTQPCPVTPHGFHQVPGQKPPLFSSSNLEQYTSCCCCVGETTPRNVNAFKQRRPQYRVFLKTQTFIYEKSCVQKIVVIIKKETKKRRQIASPAYRVELSGQTYRSQKSLLEDEKNTTEKNCS